MSWRRGDGQNNRIDEAEVGTVALRQDRCYRDLAAAVLHAAYLEAQNAPEAAAIAAYDWLMFGRDVAFWCGILDVAPHALRTRVFILVGPRCEGFKRHRSRQRQPRKAA